MHFEEILKNTNTTT